MKNVKQFFLLLILIVGVMACSKSKDDQLKVNKKQVQEGLSPEEKALVSEVNQAYVNLCEGISALDAEVQNKYLSDSAQIRINKLLYLIQKADTTELKQYTANVINLALKTRLRLEAKEVIALNTGSLLSALYKQNILDDNDLQASLSNLVNNGGKIEAKISIGNLMTRQRISFVKDGDTFRFDFMDKYWKSNFELKKFKSSMQAMKNALVRFGGENKAKYKKKDIFTPLVK